MRHYENLVIIKPTLTAEEIEKEISTIDEIITSNGGEIAGVQNIGMRKLAYPILKNERGYYYVVFYKNQPTSISEIERRFRINENLLRFVTIKYENDKEIKAWNEMIKKSETTQAKQEETQE